MSVEGCLRVPLRRHHPEGETMLRLETPTTALNALHAMLDGRGKNRTIDRDTLAKLLIDHERMAKKLQDEGIQIGEAH
jgi:hypothetical protein